MSVTEVKVELPADIIAEMEGLTRRPHPNAREWTDLEDSIILEGRARGLEWSAIIELLKRHTDSRPPCENTVRYRWRKLTGGE